MLRRHAPVLPVADLPLAAAHYEALGFEVARYDGTYAFARRDGLELHLSLVEGHDPATSTSAVYLWVDDADALAAAWSVLPGRHVPPTDTEYDLREGAHVDPDGNLLRFGSPLPPTT